jgi:hypothetical protein
MTPKFLALVVALILPTTVMAQNQRSRWRAWQVEQERLELQRQQFAYEQFQDRLRDQQILRETYGGTPGGLGVPLQGHGTLTPGSGLSGQTPPPTASPRMLQSRPIGRGSNRGRYHR